MSELPLGSSSLMNTTQAIEKTLKEKGDDYMHSDEYNEYLSELKVEPCWKSKAEIKPMIERIKNDIFIHDKSERMELVRLYEEYANTLPDHYHYPRYDYIEDGWNIIEGHDVYVENNKVMRAAYTGLRPFERLGTGWILVSLTPTEFAKAVIDDKISWF